MDWSIDPGDLIKAAAVLVSAAGLILVALRNRSDRRRAEADAVRRSAGEIVAKLERWAQIVEHHIDSLHPDFVEADSRSVAGDMTEAVRDQLWSRCFEARQHMRRDVLDEELELVYVNLYGYDDRIQSLYDACTRSLRLSTESAFELIVQGTQEIVVRKNTGDRRSSVLGNELRYYVAEVRHAFQQDSARVVSVLRSELVTLVNASDRAVLGKTAFGPSFGEELLNFDALRTTELLISSRNSEEYTQDVEQCPFCYSSQPKVRTSVRIPSPGMCESCQCSKERRFSAEELLNVPLSKDLRCFIACDSAFSVGHHFDPSFLGTSGSRLGSECE